MGYNYTLNHFMKTNLPQIAGFLLTLFLIFPSLAAAQKPVGVVTALKGRAQLNRTGTQTALHFKKNLILHDIIDTQEGSLVRVLFGGKSTVTVREFSRLEVREELLPGAGFGPFTIYLREASWSMSPVDSWVKGMRWSFVHPTQLGPFGAPSSWSSTMPHRPKARLSS